MLYESFYGLAEKPFSIQPDPHFLYFSRRHALAYSMLQYGIENKAGFMVVTGEIGSGKTTLIRHLLNNLQYQFRVGLINNTHPDIADILSWVMLAFDQPYEGMSKVALYDAFLDFLIKEYATGRRVILIIDEAQNLSPRAIEALRMLSNINADKHQLLQMILLGQPQFKELLQRPDLRQFAQRVAVDFHITPLSVADVDNYIAHRMNVAGRGDRLFTPEAAQLIAEYSGGLPRAINIVCDLALVYGFSAGAQVIGKEIVLEVIRDRREYGVFDSRSAGGKPRSGTSDGSGSGRLALAVNDDPQSVRETLRTWRERDPGGGE